MGKAVVDKKPEEVWDAETLDYMNKHKGRYTQVGVKKEKGKTPAPESARASGSGTGSPTRSPSTSTSAAPIHKRKRVITTEEPDNGPPESGSQSDPDGEAGPAKRSRAESASLSPPPDLPDLSPTTELVEEKDDAAPITDQPQAVPPISLASSPPPGFKEIVERDFRSRSATSKPATAEELLRQLDVSRDAVALAADVPRRTISQWREKLTLFENGQQSALKSVHEEHQHLRDLVETILNSTKEQERINAELRKEIDGLQTRVNTGRKQEEHNRRRLQETAADMSQLRKKLADAERRAEQDREACATLEEANELITVDFNAKQQEVEALKVALANSDAMVQGWVQYAQSRPSAATPSSLPANVADVVGSKSTVEGPSPATAQLCDQQRYPAPAEETSDAEVDAMDVDPALLDVAGSTQVPQTLPPQNLPLRTTEQQNLEVSTATTVNVPHQNLPQTQLQTLPPQTLPQQTLPQQTLPQQTLPRQILPHRTSKLPNPPLLNDRTPVSPPVMQQPSTTSSTAVRQVLRLTDRPWGEMCEAGPIPSTSEKHTHHLNSVTSPSSGECAEPPQINTSSSQPAGHRTENVSSSRPAEPQGPGVIDVVLTPPPAHRMSPPTAGHESIMEHGQPPSSRAPGEEPDEPSLSRAPDEPSLAHAPGEKRDEAPPSRAPSEKRDEPSLAHAPGEKRDEAPPSRAPSEKRDEAPSSPPRSEKRDEAPSSRPPSEEPDEAPSSRAPSEEPDEPRLPPPRSDGHDEPPAAPGPGVHSHVHDEPSFEPFDATRILRSDPYGDSNPFGVRPPKKPMQPRPVGTSAGPYTGPTDIPGFLDYPTIDFNSFNSDMSIEQMRAMASAVVNPPRDTYRTPTPEGIYEYDAYEPPRSDAASDEADDPSTPPGTLTFSPGGHPVYPWLDSQEEDDEDQSGLQDTTKQSTASPNPSEAAVPISPRRTRASARAQASGSGSQIV